MVQNRTHINDIIIPFFIKYPLVNIKELDLDNLSKVMALFGQPGWKESVKLIIYMINSKRLIPDN